MKATVLHVTTGLGSDGAEGMLQRLVLADRGPDGSRQVIISLTDTAIDGTALRESGIELHCLGLNSVLRFPAAFLRLVSLMRTIRPDVVMTWLNHANFIGTLAAVMSGIGASRVVWNQRSFPRTTRWLVTLLAWLSPLPWGIATISRSGKQAHKALGYRARRWFRLPNPIDADERQPSVSDRATARCDLALDESALAVGVIARGDTQEDHATFLAAAELLMERHKEARFILAGRNIDKLKMSRRLDARSLFLGAQLKIRPLLRGLDLIVVSSAHGKGCPNMLVEAMAAGVPCVVTDSGDAASLVGDSGLVVPAQDADALAAAVSALLAEDSVARDLRGQQARETIRNRYGIRRTVDSYRQLWRFVSGIEPRPVTRRRRKRRGHLSSFRSMLRKASKRLQFGGQFRRRWRGRFGPVLQRLKYRRAQLRRLLLTKTTFIAVTGSCGKTTTVKLAVDMLTTGGPCYQGGIGNVLRYSVRAVLSVPASSKYFVREVSGHRPGAIAKHVRVLRPHIAIVTTIGGDHYTNFRSLEATAREKGQLVENLSRHGTAILNADDPHVRAMADRTRAKVLTFGLSPRADVRGTEVSSIWPDHLTLTVVHGHESLRVQTRLVGKHWATSVLAAIACGIVCGIDLRTCGKVLEKFNPVFGRYSIHAKPGGPVYVLDTRKAPLWTIAKGLAFVARAQAPRKTIVFGTIADCPGAGSPKYRRVAREALQVADRVMFVGPNAGHVSKLRQGELQGRLLDFQTSYQASAFLAEEVLPEELIYIKASITDHLDRLMLSQLDQVVCWRERCGKKVECRRCSNYHRPHAPPFGLAES